VWGGGGAGGPPWALELKEVISKKL
jgi:hypothetical protein